MESESQTEQPVEQLALVDWLKPQERPRAMPANIRLDDLGPKEAFEAFPAPRWLVKSIKEFGVVVPIVVADRGDVGYDVIEGRKRINAARAAKLEEIPCRVFDSEDVGNYADLLSIALNEQRQANHVTNFQGVKRLFERGLSVKQIARGTGLTQTTTRTYLELAGVNTELVERFEKGEITFGVFRKISRLSRQNQNEIEALAVSGIGITGKVVNGYRPVVPVQGEVFVGDPLKEWLDKVVEVVEELLDEAPHGAPIIGLETVLADFKPSARRAA